MRLVDDLGTLALIPVTPFCAAAGLAGAWVGAKLRPWAVRGLAAMRQSR